jgi:hypothetical protein
MKATILQAWPELEEFIPLLTSPSETSSLTSIFNIDFSECEKVDSCGLTAFMLKIKQYMKKVKGSTWRTGEKNGVLETTIKLKFFLPIASNYHDSLFHVNEYIPLNGKTISSNMFGASKISFPIFYIDFSNSINRREKIKEFKTVLFSRLLQYQKVIKIFPLITIFFELAKNSADHTDDNAIFGLDLLETEHMIKINFLYGDFGVGIKQNIQNHLKCKNDPRGPHLSLSEAYHIACQKGFTSKPESGINFGLGLSIVIEIAKSYNINLSVFDASSRCLLSRIDIASCNSHTYLRRKMFNFSRNNPFCYYGTMEAKKNENISK